jgi:predicted ATP-dependent protease
MLSSWTKKSQENLDEFVRFIAQTIEEDGKVPHFTREAVNEALRVAEKMALQFDGQRDALTLRFRELGGLIRIAGDLAVQDDEQLVQSNHVKRAEVLSRGIDMGSTYPVSYSSPEQANRDYFF